MSDGNKNIESLNLEKVTAILLDVAGTTTAINFVKDTLLPYVTKSVDEFLKSSWEDEEVKKAVSQFEEKDLDVTKASEIVKTLTEKNDSNVALKTIQGLIFKKGYESGELKGHVFADVPKSLEIWSKSKKIAIFSTGSVDSQQLLFKNTVEGDISSHISKYFDQSVGVKSEEASYRKIAEELDVTPENILFLTDDAKEAEAATSANLTVVLVERDGNSPISEDLLSSFAVIKSFTDIPMESVKRKIEEDSVEQPPNKIAKIEVVGIVEKEFIKTDQNVENKPKVEEINDEVMEVDVNEKSTETSEKDKAESANESITTEKKSDEKPTTENKSNTEEPSKTEENSPVKASVPINEEKHSNDHITESTSVETEKPTIQEKPITEEKPPVKEESMNQEKEVAPVVEESETMEVEQTVESEIKLEELAKQCTETEKLEAAKETEKLAATKETDKLEEAKETEKVAETIETINTEKVEVKESTREETCEPNVPENKKECKTEIEIGTQTKTITNECETQTTISIKVAEELPAKEVQEKLMASLSENKKVDDMKSTEEGNIEEKTNKTETNGDKIDEEKEKKVDKVCDSIDTKKDLVINTNGNEEKNGVVECKLEKTKADNSLPEEKVSVAEEPSKENKDKNTITEVNETQQTNGDIPKENGVSEMKSITADVVIEEKENKSDLANGTDNCVSNGEASSSAVDSVEMKEEEIKIKTIEDKVENTPVSVEA